MAILSELGPEYKVHESSRSCRLNVRTRPQKQNRKRGRVSHGSAAIYGFSSEILRFGEAEPGRTDSRVTSQAPMQPDERKVDAVAEIARRLIDNLETVVHGKSEESRLVLSAVVAGGHVLLEDVPGTAKTILARAIAGSIEGIAFSRIQCTPDLQPTDATGLSIFDQERRSFVFQPGPLFANVVLVDEINRAT